MPKTLYICYFGLREPLVQTQVLPYLREIRKLEDPTGERMGVTLLTFEPEFRKTWTREQIYEQRRQLLAEGIEWQVTGYHKSPSVPATFFDILNGVRIVSKLLRNDRYDVIHGRVHIPTLMGALARKLSSHRPKLLFDIRGFFPEEYTDAGRWPVGGWLYRAAKRVERWLLQEADGFVVLTEQAREILFPESRETGLDRRARPVEVIPCCVDLKRFNSAPSREEARSRLGVQDKFLIVYVGSFGGWYLTEEMMDFFETARAERSDTFVMILTQRDKEMVTAQLRQRGFAESDLLVTSVKATEIADLLVAGDVAVSFIKACYSKRSSSPTKIAEYLASGLPVIANRGVGDLDALLGGKAGTLVDDFTERSYRAALSSVTYSPDRAHYCRKLAAKEFDLAEIGGVRYRRLYSALLSN